MFIWCTESFAYNFVNCTVVSKQTKCYKSDWNESKHTFGNDHFYAYRNFWNIHRGLLIFTAKNIAASYIQGGLYSDAWKIKSWNYTWNFWLQV